MSFGTAVDGSGTGAVVDEESVARLASLLDQTEFMQRCDDYANTWAPVDDEIRHVCEVRCAGHDAFRTVYPKVAIVDGTYRAGLSRCITKKGDGSFDALSAVAHWMCGDGLKTMDRAIEMVHQEARSESAAYFHDCLVGHGSVVSELAKIGSSGKWPTSFVSKYLHFHNREYVIFDNVVEQGITRLMSRAGGLPRGFGDVPRPASMAYSNAYYEYLRRFYYVYAAATRLRDGVSVKEIDHYLWNAWI